MIVRSTDKCISDISALTDDDIEPAEYVLKDGLTNKTSDTTKSCCYNASEGKKVQHISLKCDCQIS